MEATTYVPVARMTAEEAVRVGPGARVTRVGKVVQVMAMGVRVVEEAEREKVVAVRGAAK
jgi:hypothetical protein